MTDIDTLMFMFILNSLFIIAIAFMVVMLRDELRDENEQRQIDNLIARDSNYQIQKQNQEDHTFVFNYDNLKNFETKTYKEVPKIKNRNYDK
jgi:hypothetical protein